MTIEIFSTPTCGSCKTAKRFFEEHGFDFVEYDVSKDKEKAQEMVDETGQMGVPVIRIIQDDYHDVLIGFSPKRLKEALNI